MKIANILTVSRLVLAPIIFVLILYQIWTYVIVLLAAAFATDIFDGYLARKLKQESKFGKVLDPIADKILVFLAIIGLLIVFGKESTNWIYGIMFFSKDIFNFFFIILSPKFKVKHTKARILGKLATVAQAVTLFWIILKLPYFYSLIWIVFIIGLASGIDYYFAFRQNLKKQR